MLLEEMEHRGIHASGPSGKDVFRIFIVYHIWLHTDGGTQTCTEGFAGTSGATGSNKTKVLTGSNIAHDCASMQTMC